LFQALLRQPVDTTQFVLRCLIWIGEKLLSLRDKRLSLIALSRLLGRAVARCSRCISIAGVAKVFAARWNARILLRRRSRQRSVLRLSVGSRRISIAGIAKGFTAWRGTRILLRRWTGQWSVLTICGRGRSGKWSVRLRRNTYRFGSRLFRGGL